MQQYEIGYCGSKPERTDTVAGTGLVWREDTTHIVSAKVAEKLLQHPDIWYVVDQVEAGPGMTLPATPPADKPEDKLREKEEEEKREDRAIHSLATIKKMTKDELCKFAHREFNIELNQTEKRESLLARVVGLIKLDSK